MTNDIATIFSSGMSPRPYMPWMCHFAPLAGPFLEPWQSKGSFP